MEHRYPVGPILSCPSDACGFGLYRIGEPPTFEDLVVFDDKCWCPAQRRYPTA
jgi:hypothetical protein